MNVNILNIINTLLMLPLFHPFGNQSLCWYLNHIFGLSKLLGRYSWLLLSIACCLVVVKRLYSPSDYCLLVTTQHPHTKDLEIGKIHTLIILIQAWKQRPDLQNDQYLNIHWWIFFHLVSICSEAGKQSQMKARIALFHLWIPGIYSFLEQLSLSN